MTKIEEGTVTVSEKNFPYRIKSNANTKFAIYNAGFPIILSGLFGLGIDFHGKRSLIFIGLILIPLP